MTLVRLRYEVKSERSERSERAFGSLMASLPLPHHIASRVKERSGTSDATPAPLHFITRSAAPLGRKRP